ncbi:MAG: Asp-tRNA(Asn)/Glu-tRNA(Gln) amidotransferase subunit GatC [Candidatus Berkelbacteria bacterium]|nr:Asp-tRNA(Asn)/Glu-tRNA(Gln) amidotransferase subunit GatC [Candidatus Berkelbacteria bacterium]
MDEIKHIAKLSRLELSEKETVLYADQLSGVLEYVEQLSEIDTTGVEPTANVTGLQNIWRDDAVSDSGFKYDDLEKNAPEFKDGSFVVPGVFE